MTHNNSCPCCSSSMLKHLSSRRSFWFCNHCRLEIPDTNDRKQTAEKVMAPFKSSALTEAIVVNESLDSFVTL